MSQAMDIFHSLDRFIRTKNIFHNCKTHPTKLVCGNLLPNVFDNVAVDHKNFFCPNKNFGAASEPPIKGAELEKGDVILTGRRYIKSSTLMVKYKFGTLASVLESRPIVFLSQE